MAYRQVMSVEELEKAGFKEFRIAPFDHHDRHWSYSVYDDSGCKKLFVIVRLWAFSKYSRPDRKVENSFDSYSQFNIRADKSFDVELGCNNMLPMQVVRWYENMFDKMGCYSYGGDGPIVPQTCRDCNRWLDVAAELCGDCLENAVKLS